MEVSSGKDLRSLRSFRDEVDIAICMEEEKGVSLKFRFEGMRELDLVRWEERIGFAGVRGKVVVAIFVSVFVLQSCS